MPCLSREQEKAFLDKLVSLSGGLDQWCCPFCGQSNKYHVAGAGMVALQTYKMASVDPEGPVMPVVALICQHCGYTHFFNAAISGTLDESLGFAK
jgi:predicted nucleic-acid-binding Zn-ribbon protein